VACTLSHPKSGSHLCERVIENHRTIKAQFSVPKTAEIN
jgi:hypothetical protein